MTSNQVLDFINSGIRCFDGAIGTMLFRLGLKSGECPELAAEQLISEVHRQYLNSGAEFITTNTFGGNRYKLANFGLEDKVQEINQRNAAIAKQVGNGRHFVAGSIGPTGKFVKPYGELEPEDLYTAFVEQVKGLVAGGVDLIMIETMAAKEELEAAIKAVKDNCSLPIIACMTFNLTPQGYRTLTGITPPQAVAIMTQAGADIVGSNCTLNPEEIIGLVREFRTATDLPILAEPNAGSPKLTANKTVYEPIKNLEHHLAEIIKAGANLVGGCCGTDPAYITTLRTIINQFSQ